MARSQKPTQSAGLVSEDEKKPPLGDAPPSQEGATTPSAQGDAHNEVDRRLATVQCTVHLNGQKFERGDLVAMTEAEFNDFRAVKALIGDKEWQDQPRAEPTQT